MVETLRQADNRAIEEAGYFEVPGGHLYTVLHAVEDPLARVLLVGPFASERHYSYIPWVRWARFLAARRIECLRYDYRGVGESTGAFEEMSFGDWVEDVRLLADWFKSRSGPAPLIVHGLELGAVLAAKNFDAGVGDALLLWAPPASANHALRSTLLRRISVDQAFRYGDERRPASSYIAQLESGETLEVEGYRWTARLWRDSFDLELPQGMDDEHAGSLNSERPIRSVKLGRQETPLIKGSSVGWEAISKDFSDLFEDNLEWIIDSVSVHAWGNV